MEHASLALEGATRARVELRYGAGDLEVRGGAPHGMLYEGTFDKPIQLRHTREGDTLHLRVGHRAPKRIIRRRQHHWSLRLADGVPIDLVLHGGAARMRLDLTGTRVESLAIHTGASDVDVVLPGTGQVDVRVSAGAANARIRVPDGMGAQVHTQGMFAPLHIDTTRFPRAGAGHRSTGFDTAQDRANIRLKGAVSTFSVD
jgi:hypothetical protein